MEFESQLALMSERITWLENENIRLKAKKVRIVKIPSTDYDSIKEELSKSKFSILFNLQRKLKSDE